MSAVKIKIECDDLELAAAITAAIGKGLEMEDFQHVAVKSGMLIAGEPNQFTRVNELIKGVQPALYESVKQRPNFARLYRFARLHVHPACLESLRQRDPRQLATPIVIDYGTKAEEDGQYIAEEVDFFLNPEVLP